MLKRSAIGLQTIVLIVLVVAGVGSAEEGRPPFPSYGSGAIEVRIYTDYFCPPCRALEPMVEPILKGLLKKKAIRLTLVDVPRHQHSLLYAKNFLYALKENNEQGHAFRVRNVLIAAATKEDFKTQERIEALFKQKGISYSVWDPRPVFDRFNALLIEDKIHATPTCVVIKDGRKKEFRGGPDIINGLKALQ